MAVCICTRRRKMPTQASEENTTNPKMPTAHNIFSRFHHGGSFSTEMSPAERIRMRKDLARQSVPKCQSFPISIRQTPVHHHLAAVLQISKIRPGALRLKVSMKNKASLTATPKNCSRLWRARSSTVALICTSRQSCLPFMASSAVTGSGAGRSVCADLPVRVAPCNIGDGILTLGRKSLKTSTPGRPGPGSRTASSPAYNPSVSSPIYKTSSSSR